MKWNLTNSMLMELGGPMPHSQGLSNNPYPESNQPNSPISSRFILILSPHLHLGLTKGLFPLGLPVNILKALLPSFILATWPVHLNLLDVITLTVLGAQYKLWSSSLRSLLQSLFSSLLGPNIRLRILFSNTLSLDSSLNVRDHVSQPYSTTGNIIVLYILIFKFMKCKLI